MTENKNEKKVIRKLPPKKAATMVETFFGCKWSLTVYSMIRDGVVRPGEMVRSVEGLSTKVLNSCLKRNLESGILEKEVFQELPLKVEYSITPFGENFIKILDDIEELNKKITKN
ncbi:transcriptional regulator [Halobacteriovorax marinus]|uniref:Transcriptional regulator n=1 Tax=Halobacteriovorax marinus TaxID=97084 RepID=A0A1Y5F4Y1_9BACT|nr:transcriptional regulator [Halobacteriovorax marinus]